MKKRGRSAQREGGKVLQAALTGEIVQPARLYYSVSSETAFLDALASLKCVEPDAHMSSWEWLYMAEARGLKFDKPYSAVPRDRRPIVIGRFYRKTADSFVLDVRTIQRATKAIVFFDQHVPRSAARVTHVAVVNRLFDAKESASSRLDHLFQNVTEIDPEAAVADLTPGTAIDAFVKQRAKKPFPAVEKFPLWYYDEGIKTIETTLMIRQMIAMQHWNGNTDYSFYDVLKQMFPGLADKVP